MTKDNLSIYGLLSRAGFPRTYLGKVWLAAFVGNQVPMLAVLIHLVTDSSVSLMTVLRFLALVLMATLAGNVVTLWALRGLLAPVRLASSSLREYLDSKQLPDLPIGFSDEAGRLMADVRYALEDLNSQIRSLEGLSGTDPLTGLLNRRQGEKLLAEEAARARRSGGVLTLGAIDVNRFKFINDTYGHQAGDACIRHVAAVVGRNIREGDWLARWGGDEFVLALRDASPFAATELVLQRIVNDLKVSPARLPGGDELTMTLSVGAVRYSGEQDLRDLLAKADEAMYQAKREGRSWILSR